jgi:hypothetical protein
MKRKIFLVLLLVLFSMVDLPANSSEHELRQTAPGVFAVPLSLPKSLEPRRVEFERDLIEAQKRLRAFALKNGWVNLTDKPLMLRAEIYHKKDDYDKHIYELEPDLRGKPIPKTFVAGIEKDVFFAVCPEIVDEVFPQGREKDSYIKLIVHELVHRLHVRILNGQEEKMGPVWFYEGFAVYGADQLKAAAPKLTETQIWDVVNAKERGSYLKYRTVFDYFLTKHSLQELLEHAGDADFTAWLKKD